MFNQKVKQTKLLFVSISTLKSSCLPFITLMPRYSSSVTNDGLTGPVLSHKTPSFTSLSCLTHHQVPNFSVLGSQDFHSLRRHRDWTTKLIPKGPCILGMGAQLNVYEHDVLLSGQEQLKLYSLH